jgi:hypothetical protein
MFEKPENSKWWMRWDSLMTEITNCSLQYCTSVDLSFNGFSNVKLHLFVACCFSLFVKANSSGTFKITLLSVFIWTPHLLLSSFILPLCSSNTFEQREEPRRLIRNRSPRIVYVGRFKFAEILERNVFV